MRRRIAAHRRRRRFDPAFTAARHTLRRAHHPRRQQRHGRQPRRQHIWAKFSEAMKARTIKANTFRHFYQGNFTFERGP